MATQKADEVAFKSTLEYRKAFAYLNQSVDVKRFNLISLSAANLQQQTDNTSCGIFACIFAYSLLHLKDYNVPNEDLTTVRYWIANMAIKGAMIPGKRELRCKNQQLWDSIAYKEDRLQRFTKLRVHRNKGPFYSLHEFFTDKESL